MIFEIKNTLNCTQLDNIVLARCSSKGFHMYPVSVVAGITMTLGLFTDGFT